MTDGLLALQEEKESIPVSDANSIEGAQHAPMHQGAGSPADTAGDATTRSAP